MNDEKDTTASTNKFPWGKVMSWTGAAFLLGLIIGDTPPHISGVINLIAQKIMTGIAAAVVVGPIAAIVVYFSRRS